MHACRAIVQAPSARDAPQVPMFLQHQEQLSVQAACLLLRPACYHSDSITLHTVLTADAAAAQTLPWTCPALCPRGRTTPCRTLLFSRTKAPRQQLCCDCCNTHTPPSATLGNAPTRTALVLAARLSTAPQDPTDGLCYYDSISTAPLLPSAASSCCWLLPSCPCCCSCCGSCCCASPWCPLATSPCGRQQHGSVMQQWMTPSGQLSLCCHPAALHSHF
jgi:hypothetical protein